MIRLHRVNQWQLGGGLRKADAAHLSREAPVLSLLMMQNSLADKYAAPEPNCLDFT